MKKKTNQIIKTDSIHNRSSIIFLYRSCFFTDLNPMTDEQYAHEAQKL